MSYYTSLQLKFIEDKEINVFFHGFYRKFIIFYKSIIGKQILSCFRKPFELHGHTIHHAFKKSWPSLL